MADGAIVRATPEMKGGTPKNGNALWIQQVSQWWLLLAQVQWDKEMAIIYIHDLGHEHQIYTNTPW
jgi:hypothetical protein